MITYLDLDSKVLFLVYVIKKAAFFKNRVEFKTVSLFSLSFLHDHNTFVICVDAEKIAFNL